MTKIEIKNRFNGEVIFAHEGNDNNIAVTIQEAVKNNVSLRSADLSSADLRSANLSSADLSNADLSDAVLRDADLSNANLSSADLSNADLRDADLSNAVLSDAVLRFADLSDAVLRSADLSNADLRDADLSDADLSDADLSSAKNVPHIHQACPTDGAFIGWKKVKGHIIKLEIPSDAERSSATSNKCRCDKALVLSITNIKSGKSIDKIDNDGYAHTEYVVGQMVYPDSWDENRFNECSHGIHFFIDKQDAIDY
jgi:uncharacterized protein YjbI with pentapeptide repeats